MLITKRNLIWWVVGIIPFVVATSGCATRRYVRNQVDPVSQHVAAVEAQSNEKIAALSATHTSDISQVNERISTNEMKISQVASAVQAAQGSAARAMEQADANAKANSAAMANLTASVEGALDYQLVDKGDVLFALNSSTLTNSSKATLNQLAQKIQSLPRAVVEIAGFTDVTGSQSYNLALSRRRAESVQRYLAQQNVPVRAIHIIGMGEEAIPVGHEAELSPASNPSKAELHQMARRVRVRIFDGGKVEGSAARTEP